MRPIRAAQYFGVPMITAKQLAFALVGIALLLSPSWLSLRPSGTDAAILTIAIAGDYSPSFTASPTRGVAPLPVQFEAALSQNTTYVLDFGDGSKAGALTRSPCKAELCPTPDTPLVIARHAYTSAGTYSAVLSDSNGARATATIVVAGRP
jgi:PKD repeat protein